MLPAILHRFIGTYDCVFDIKKLYFSDIRKQMSSKQIGLFDFVTDKINHA